jgi:TetR/AcrR family transcriptional regulator
MDDQKAKERIAEAFRRRFEHFGFKKTSVDEVAKELHISKKTVYRHFTSKEKVFAFIMEKVADGYCRKMLAEIRDEPTVRARLHALIARIFQETGKWNRTRDAFEFRFKHELAEMAFSRAYQSVFLRLLQEGKEKGEFLIDDPEVSARFLQGVLSKGIELQEREPDKDFVDVTLDGVDRLIGRGP